MRSYTVEYLVGPEPLRIIPHALLLLFLLASWRSLLPAIEMMLFRCLFAYDQVFRNVTDSIWPIHCDAYSPRDFIICKPTKGSRFLRTQTWINLSGELVQPISEENERVR